MENFSKANQEISRIFSELKTKENGLTQKEAKLRFQKYGPNKIIGKETKWWHILANQFKSPFIYILIFCSVLAGFLGEMVDSMMIIIFIAINTILGFIQEYYSEKTVKLLKNFVSAKARVKRNSKETLIDASELTIGDIVMVETGDIIPADIRFFQTNDLSVDESLISGESAPVFKTSDKIEKKITDISQAQNLGFFRTSVVSGKGEGIVLGIGNKTIVGQMAKLTIETKRESIFEKGILKLSKFILRMVVIMIILLFVSNIAMKGKEADIFELILFSVALAVSVIPEALPVVTTVSFSRGAKKMAKEHVVVKRLSAVEDLGSIQVLCTDKTGTITENKMQVADVFSGDEKKTIFFASLASSFLGEGKSEPNNAFDLAVWKKLDNDDRTQIKNIKRLCELPFDPNRKRNSVVSEFEKQNILIVRGAEEAIVDLCSNLDFVRKKEIQEWVKNQGKQGRRTIAVAWKKVETISCYKEDIEKDLEFLGAISFIDPIKKSAKQTIKEAKDLNVFIKILTGDSREVAGAVAKEIGLVQNASEVITGEEFDNMDEANKASAVKKYSVFARVSPQQKYKIIELLMKKFEVGFLGEGINDAPALKLANVAIVVDGASDIAREAADIVLLKHSLKVIIGGVRNGREIFANTVKYLKITLISNFGNFYAIALASLMIPFLPMLPVQILLLNLLSDFPMISIAADSVDKEELRNPRTYNVKGIALIAILLGLVSTVFDFIIFSWFKSREPSVLQTNWFIGSVLTEIILIYSVRTRKFFAKAKFPAKIVIMMTGMAVAATIIVPFTYLGDFLFRFSHPLISDLLILFGIVGTYFVVTEVLKLVYYRYATLSNVDK